MGRSGSISLSDSLSTIFAAAAFFTAYENLKHNLPKHSSTFNQNPALTHMFAASGGEFVSLDL
jgi:hypothetical protein